MIWGGEPVLQVFKLYTVVKKNFKKTDVSDSVVLRRSECMSYK